jgi:uncharacterized protein YcgL (UPF0745 family)
MSDKLLCEVFKSLRKNEMYLYVDKRQVLTQVPELPPKSYDNLVPVFTMLLNADKPLLRVNAVNIVERVKKKDSICKCRRLKRRICSTYIASMPPRILTPNSLSRS